mmetsp:Transcript_12655/g.15718  ORF Transcript_12655/g.15718 Transcript_12655/m.15718 type:complete len:96 (+) Transcript_12655:251-538(+)
MLCVFVSVEVNASPSLSATTKSDRIMKNDLLYEIFSLLVPRKNVNANGSFNSVNGPEININNEPTNFKLLYDGSIANVESNETKQRMKNKQPTWR